MEMVSRDMKALGIYLSGSISFGVCPQSGKAVEYRERIHRLTHSSAKCTTTPRRLGKVYCAILTQPWKLRTAGHEREQSHLTSFGETISDSSGKNCAFKVPRVIAETEAALSQGKSVVISLVGTGEARTKEQVAKATANGGMLELCDVPGYVASSPQLLTNEALEQCGRHIS